VVVGDGKRFFPDGVQLDLELVQDRRSVGACFSDMGSAPDTAIDLNVERGVKNRDPLIVITKVIYAG